MKEIWKDIKEYEGLYQGSNFGRIKSLYFNREHIMKFWIIKGYYYVCLVDRNGKRTSFRVHRLIAQAWIENPQNLPEINHKNGITTDNRIENLMWCDHTENIRWSYDKLGFKRPCGNLCPNHKLDDIQISEIKNSLKNGISGIELSKKWNISRATISRIKHNKNYKT